MEKGIGYDPVSLLLPSWWMVPDDGAFVSH
jgi:hypothetical protein